MMRGNFGGVLRIMRPYGRFQLDYFALLKEAKRLDPAACAGRLRLALLADFSTRSLAPLLKVLFSRDGIAVDLYEGGFDAVRLEAIDERSGLYAFKPDLIVILNDARVLREGYYRLGISSTDFARRTVDSLASVWEAIGGRTQATLVQGNLAVPYDRLFGNGDQKAGASFAAAVREINRLLDSAAREAGSPLICDIDYVASYMGRGLWFDERLWILEKSPCAFDCLPHMAQAVVDIAGPLTGRVVKCVAFDLDETLWGGVIGEDGLGGIRLGRLGEGEAYVGLQEFLLGLKRRGILLAVCSRNDFAAAVEPFRAHPDMLLKESDIAVFIANWESKAENLKAIAAGLHIGSDSIVFLDDDPFERNLVRGLLPEVIVPELPEDAAERVKALCELNLFEAVSFSDEDRRRASMRQEQAARPSPAQFRSKEDYLRSLKMKISLARFDSFHLPRIAQLISRSNQFNLTTKRYSQADCERFMKAEDFFPFYVRLRDEFGDSGLVAVAILALQGETIEIDEWLMSCRVLLRGLEDCMMNRVFRFAEESGARRVVGRYCPTPKNGIVKDFFSRFGFDKQRDLPGGGAVWALDVERYHPKTVFFTEDFRG